MINREKLKVQHEKELKLFEQNHPKSKEMYLKAKGSLLQGVPLNWMVRWSSAYPIAVKNAKGAHLTCADGHDYIDFCLGDTGSMVGHAPDPAVKAIIEHAQKGTTFMLPTEDSTWNGEELQRRFGLKYWQFSTSATDANRFSLRFARAVTGRSKVLVFNYCYHGSVDETLGTIQADGSVSFRKGNVGQAVNPAVTTKIIEWNDIPALEAALKDRDVIAVLAEPVMTNCG